MQSPDASLTCRKHLGKSRNTNSKLVSHCSVDLPVEDTNAHSQTVRANYYNMSNKRRPTSGKKVKALRVDKVKSKSRSYTFIHLFESLKLTESRLGHFI